MEEDTLLSRTEAFASQQALTESWARLAGEFREMHRLGATRYDSAEEQYTDYLVTGMRLLDMQIGIVSRIRDDVYTILTVQPPDAALRTGQHFRLSDTYCAWVLEKEAPVALHRIGEDPERSRHPAYRSTGLEAYVAAPIWVEGRIFGTLNFSDSRPRELPFSDEDWGFVELMARGLGQAIERTLLEERRALATERMRENVELFESAFRYASNGIALVAPDGRWLRVNRAVCEILGYPENELLTIDFQSITHPHDLEADLNYVHEMLAGERDSYRMEKRYYHRDGHTVWVLLSVSLVRHEDGSPRYFVSQLHDITDQKRTVEELRQKRSQLELANRRLRHLATHDALTQLLNRHAFDGRLEGEINRARRSGLPMSLLLLDVDHFKKFNDNFGHPAGDRALQEVARTLTTEGRIDDIVARYGGEEFAIILPNTDAAGCRIVVERLLVAVADIGDLECGLTTSIGAATFEPGAPGAARTTSDMLIDRADEALYAAKAAGRNQCQYAPLPTG